MYKNTCRWIGVQNLNCYLEKWLSFAVLSVLKGLFLRNLPGFQHFSEFNFLSDFGRSKGVLGSSLAFLTKIWHSNMYCTTQTENLKFGPFRNFDFLKIILVRKFWLEGSGKSGPAGNRACSAGPDSQPPVINSGMTAEFRAESLTCPHSRTRLVPLTDFNWPRSLPSTADHLRQEDHATGAGATRTRAVRTGSPALYQLSYRGEQG